MPYIESSQQLKELPISPKFQTAIEHYPEWCLEAWLADELNARRNKTGTPFEHITPLDYCEMLLQVSSPFSASKADRNGVALALRANGHSDILVRMGTAKGSRLGVLELKAGENKKNISKSLCQAFSYAYCYYRLFKGEHTTERANVLKVLGYDKPYWAISPPPLEAIAVVPEGFSKAIIGEAKERGLFNSEAVHDKSIKCFLWEYRKVSINEYKFVKMVPVAV